jgi:RHS repeat-associated protein
VFGPLGGPAFGSRLDDQLGRAQQALSSISSGVQKASTGLRNTAKSYRDNDRGLADGFKNIGNDRSGKPDMPGGPTSPSGGVPKPDVPKPDVPKPDVPKPDVPKPDVPKPDVPKPDVPKPDVPKPDVPKPDVPKPDVPKPDLPDGSTSPSSAPEIPKPEIPKPEIPKPDLPKPDLPKPDVPKPDVPSMPSGSTSPSGAGKPEVPSPPKMEMPSVPKPETPSLDAPPTPPTPNIPTPKLDGPDSPNKPSDPRDTGVGKDGMTKCSDPVDVASGQVLLEQVDVELPAPLTLERLHLSSYRAGLWFGRSWTSTIDQRLELDDKDVCYFSPDGMILVYPMAAAGVPVMPVEGPRWPLTMSQDGTYTLTSSARELSFGPLPGRGRAVLPLSSITDRGGARVEVDYDDLGAPRLLRHSSGYRLEVRTAAGRVTELRVLEPGRNTGVLVTRFGYDPQGRLTQVIDSSGIPLVHDYDVDGRLTGWQDRNGHWYRYVYDAAGRCVRTVGDQGYLDGAFTYDRDAGITVFTDSLGNQTAYHLNKANQVVRVVDPLGGVTVSVWDRYDRLLSRTDPLGRTTGYEYTPDGELAAIIRPDGSRIGLDQRADGTTVITGGAWERTYPADDAPEVFTDRVGVATGFRPDRQLGGRDSEKPPTAPVERDLFGRPRLVADAMGARTRLGWTVEGRRASRIGPLGRREEWHYDPEGNNLAHVEPGRVTRYEYGPMDLPLATVDPTGARTTYEYDTELRLIRVTNPAGLTWQYRYDAAGRLVGEIDFDGRALRFEYDAAGQVVRSANGAGEVTTYAYDPLGNMIERRSPAGVTTYAYDAAGMLVRATDGETVLELERDEQGRVLRETVNGRGVDYTYGELDIRRRTPSGMDSAWTFDPSGNPRALTVAGHVVTFRHDEAGREIERTTGPAVLTQVFDAENQLTGQTVTADNRIVQQRKYRYHVDGQLTGVDDAISGPVRYRLDPSGRVTEVTAPDGTESYRYDQAGNIVHAQLPASPELGPRQYTGNALTAAGPVRYTYDQQGRMTTRTDTAAGGRTWTYSWDPLDRLTGVRTPDGTSWRYRYDPLGRRIAKQRLAPGPDGPSIVEEFEFVWSGQFLVEQVHRDPRGQRLVTTWDYRPGTTRPVTQTEQLAAGIRFFTMLTDQIGTPVDMIDPNGVVAWHNSTSLWGRAKPRPAGEVSTPLRFPGQYVDHETGLHYNVFRYYDPGTGRYLSQDPLGLTPAPNPVSYLPNPLLESDPLGLGCCMSREDSTNGQEGGSGQVSPRPQSFAGQGAGNVQSGNVGLPSDVTTSQPGGSSSRLDSPELSGDGPGGNDQDRSADRPGSQESQEGNDPNSPNAPGENDGDTPGNDTDIPGGDTRTDLSSPEFHNRVDEIKNELGVQGPVKVVSLPEKVNGEPLTLGHRLGDLPANSTYGLSAADRNRFVGEFLGAFTPQEIQSERATSEYPAKDFIKDEGEATYNSRDRMIFTNPNVTPEKIFHEIGHQEQQERLNMATLANVNRSLLEYENLLQNENRAGGLRDNYMHDNSAPRSVENKYTWEQLETAALDQGNPNREANARMLDGIKQNLQDPKYDGRVDAIKQNLVDEYFGYNEDNNRPRG